MNNPPKILMNGRHEIRAVYDDDSIRVYQAYCNEIANEALEYGKFGSRFSMTRMSWIKPSFLWMMYRCGWGQKPGQERILAIDIKRSGFDIMLGLAVPASWHEEFDLTNEEWKKQVHDSDVVVQWDPERDINGTPLAFRSLQMGLRRKVLEKYVHDWTLDIEDISENVRQLYQMKNNGKDILSLLPKERVYNWTFTKSGKGL